MQGPRSGLKVGRGGAKIERSEKEWGTGDLPPESFLNHAPFKHQRTGYFGRQINH